MGDPTSMSRRRWLALLGASMALAGVSGCRSKSGHNIVPYVTTPPEVTPGVLRYYATSLDLDGFATGILVESHEGRPTKVEGNPQHPASLGSTGVYEQASVLGLYDQHRARAARRGAAPATWRAFVQQFEGARSDRGAGLRFVLRPTGSPLLLDLIGRVQARYPAARFTFYAPARSAHPARGAELAFGAPLQAQYDFRTADVILALDADFLASMPFSVRYARQFAERRRIGSPTGAMNRLYVIEPGLTPTGSMADHRLRKRPSDVPAIAAAIAAELLLTEGARPGLIPPQALGALDPLRARVSEAERRFARAVARDLARGGAASVVVAGERQPPGVHALAHLMNAALRNDGAAWTTAGTLITAGAAEQDLTALAEELRRGAVDTLVLLENNVVYTAPADLELAALLGSVPSRVYLGLYEDETAAGCDWFVPAAHDLEAWGDARAYDGTSSLIQPLIEPLFQGRTAAEVLAVFAGETQKSARDLLREAWAARRGGADFDAFWEDALRRGLVEGTAAPREDAKLRLDGVTAALAQLAAAAPPKADAIEVAFSVDASVYDGRFANNPWLLELPDPMTKLTWDNAALLSPATAPRARRRERGCGRARARAAAAMPIPVLVVPGHADGAVVARTSARGRSGRRVPGRGAWGPTPTGSAPRPRPSSPAGVSVTKIGRTRHKLALTQTALEPGGAPHRALGPPRRLPRAPRLHGGAQGAAAVPPAPDASTGAPEGPMGHDHRHHDLHRLQRVRRSPARPRTTSSWWARRRSLHGREMHWLRIDHVRVDGPATRRPAVVHQPMLCQHCEKAPCEYVCPVNATVAQPRRPQRDGLQPLRRDAVLLEQLPVQGPPLQLVRLQRAPRDNAALAAPAQPRRHRARARRDGEVHLLRAADPRGPRSTRACESRADPPGRGRHRVPAGVSHAAPSSSAPSRTGTTRWCAWRSEPRSYAVLHELGTRPRTVYLARIHNPNPELG